MPVAASAQVRGLKISVVPKRFYRRWWLSPLRSFCIENHKQDFNVRVERTDAEPPNDPWPNGKIPFRIQYADKQGRTRLLPVPTLAVGKTAVLDLDQVFVPVPGQTRIGVVLHPEVHNPWHVVYA